MHPEGGASFVTGGSGFIGGRLIERLVAAGIPVRALARSDRSAAAVEACGAEAVRGDLADVEAMTAAARGCDTAYHLAAKVEMWGSRDDFIRDNVTGTENVLTAARRGGVRRFVHCGTEAALNAGEPLRSVDETAPLRPDSPAQYPATKARAEQAVIAANGDGFETVVVRPRFVWGAGDTSLLPSMVAMVKSGGFAWIGGGKQLTDVTHVDNVVEGLVLGARKAAAARRISSPTASPWSSATSSPPCSRPKESTHQCGRSRPGWPARLRPGAKSFGAWLRFPAGRR
jgi:nucleoside-diphosphate-sugar epimerase